MDTELRQKLDGQIAEFEHQEAFLERYTTLPLRRVRMDVELARIEKKLFENLHEAERFLCGAVRAAEMLERDAGELRFLHHRIQQIQAEELERGEEA